MALPDHDRPCATGDEGPLAEAGPCCTDSRVETSGSVAPRDETVARACKALGHPARVAIMRHLLEADHCVCGRIVQVLPLAQSTVSQHLKILKEAGLVRGEVDGPRTCYCVHKDNLAALRKALAEFCGQGARE